MYLFFQMRLFVVVLCLFFLLSFTGGAISEHVGGQRRRRSERISRSPVKQVEGLLLVGKSKAVDVHSNNNKSSKAAPLSTASHPHSMSMLTLIINIVADLCPHGMLPLAYGLVKGPTGLIPALALLFAFGIVSAATMVKYASLAQATNSSTISEIWAKLVGPKSSWVTDGAIFALCFGCCIFYSAFIGDIFSALASAVGIGGILAKRWAILGLISSVVLLPLCQLEDISALSFSSILGVGGIFYTFLFHILRLWDKSYAPKGGKFFLKIATQSRPSFPTPKYELWNINKETLILVNMLCVAYLAHYNAINYFKELSHTTIPRYATAIGSGFGIAMAVFAGMMIVGYSIFGYTAQPLILNNFHRTDDLLSTVARFATGLAITFAYPLMFAGLKSSMKNLLSRTSKSNNDSGASFAATATTTKTVGVVSKGRGGKSVAIAPPSAPLVDLKTVAVPVVLAAITSIAFKCSEDDVSVVLGIVGSVLGCSVAYILPGFLQLRYLKLTQSSSLSAWVSNSALVGLGLLFSVLGVWITLAQGSEAHHHH